jgi:hypothetical protein
VLRLCKSKFHSEVELLLRDQLSVCQLDQRQRNCHNDL